MDLDSIVEKLEALSLKEFINEHQHELCKTTVNQNKVAAFLQFDFDLGAIINEPPDNFSKCQRLYELIQRKSKVRDFLEALKETGNEHIIELIEAVHLSIHGESSFFNTKTGIWFNIPEPIDSFCGREDFLSQLHEKLQNQHPVESQSAEAAVAGPSRPKSSSTISTSVTVLSQVKIVSGLGGIGKTETATQYIWSHRKSYNNFIWINAESESSMRNSFTKLATELEIPVKNEEGKSREIEEIVKEIYTNISNGKKSNLMVFDNAEDYQSCKTFFPIELHPDLKKSIVILATSRNQEWTSATGKIQVLPLGVLTDDESLEFILTQLETEDSPELREESREFIQLIGGLPLALQQAVAYIRNEKELQKFHGKSYRISDYVLEFKKSMKKFQTFPPNPESSATVYVTWNMTFQRIHSLANGEEAIKILELLSFLYADKIPLPFLRDVIPEIEDRKFSEALKLIEKYSLMKMNAKDFFVSIHRQLQFVILQYLEECKEISKLMTNLFEKCLVVLKKIKISNESESNDIFLNLHQILNTPFKCSVTMEFLDLTINFESVLDGAGRYGESLKVYELIHCLYQEMLGPDHEQTLKSLGVVASQLSKLGKYGESIALSRELLNKIKGHPDFGEDHLYTISTKLIIVHAFVSQYKTEESLELLQEILTQRIKIQGESHPETIETQSLIAQLSSQLGDSSKSSALYLETENRRKEMGILNPNSQKDELWTRHNRATRLYLKGEFPEAAKVFKEIYEENKETLGENHPDTLNTLVQLTNALQKETGNLPEALNQFKKVYQLQKSKLGEDHSDSIDGKLRIATTLFEMEEYDDSLEMFQEICNQQPRIPEERQQQALKGQYAIVLVYLKQGQLLKGLELLQHVEQEQREILGSNHPDTLKTQNVAHVLVAKLNLEK